MRRKLFTLLMVLFVSSACLLPTVVDAPTQVYQVEQQDTSTEPPVVEQEQTTNYGEAARGYMETLIDFSPREAGTQAEADTADYIASVLSGFGYSTEIQPFSYTSDDGGQVDSANVVAVKEGDSTEVIIIGAHYDTVEADGADDNSSGVAVMLEAAGLLQDIATPYTVIFIAFGAEEVGFLGAYAYVDGMSEEEIQNTIVMVNLDSVVAGDYAFIYSDEGDGAAVRDWAIDWGQTNGFDIQTIEDVKLTDEEGYGSSDYAPFQEAGIPFAYFEATNWDLGDEDGYTQVDTQYGENGVIRHTEYDTLEYLDETFPGRVDNYLNLYTTLLFQILTQFEGSN